MMLTSLAEVTAKLQLAAEARSIGLAVNESNKKLLLSSTAKDSSILQSVDIDGYNFDSLYLGSSINTANDISLETRRIYEAY